MAKCIKISDLLSENLYRLHLPNLPIQAELIETPPG